MPYFFTYDNLKFGIEIKIQGEEARHILLSHRIKVGEQIKLQGPDGKRFLCEVLKVDKKSLTAKVLSSLAIPSEPYTQITLFQAVVSEKALDFIFQKGTELGLSKIVLFNSANVATKLTLDLFNKKKERWNKILMEAAKQSERAKWPELLFTADVAKAMDLIKTCNQIFLADMAGVKFKASDGALNSMGLIIGPEGGFTESEFAEFKRLKNCQTISLSNFVLRAETAAIAGISVVLK
jgi:16S rRNA (uracil1498-N3)-methyltransferase